MYMNEVLLKQNQLIEKFSRDLSDAFKSLESKLTGSLRRQEALDAQQAELARRLENLEGKAKRLDELEPLLSDLETFLRGTQGAESAFQDWQSRAAQAEDLLRRLEEVIPRSQQLLNSTEKLCGLSTELMRRSQPSTESPNSPPSVPGSDPQQNAGEDSHPQKPRKIVL
jgi:chromosome segregation ATPase